MTPEQEAAVRADEKLKTLRKVRNELSKLDKDPRKDPYLWGYGASQLISVLGRMIREERERQGVETPGRTPPDPASRRSRRRAEVRRIIATSVQE